MPGFLSPRKGVPLLLISEYSGINKGQRIPDNSPYFIIFVKKVLTKRVWLVLTNQLYRKAMINNKYNHQDNHQSYSSRPAAAGSTLKPYSWV